MDEELRLISQMRNQKQKDYLSKELDRYDDLNLRNQDTAATLNFEKDFKMGPSLIMSSTSLPQKLKNIDREYEVSKKR